MPHPQNHSCSPSLYARLLRTDGHPHLGLFARTPIAAGQELTLDFRPQTGEGEERQPCACGAPNCRVLL